MSISSVKFEGDVATKVAPMRRIPLEFAFPKSSNSNAKFEGDVGPKAAPMGHIPLEFAP